MYLSVTAQTSVLDMTHLMEQKTDTPDKQIRIPCSEINVRKLGTVFALLGKMKLQLWMSGSIMSCIAWLSKLNIWKRLIETTQELICLKGVLMIEIWLIQ